jgi:hypothetical protein
MAIDDATYPEQREAEVKSAIEIGIAISPLPQFVAPRFMG